MSSCVSSLGYIFENQSTATFILCVLTVEAEPRKEGDTDKAGIVIKKNGGWPEKTFSPLSFSERLHWNENTSLECQYADKLLTNVEQICQQLHLHTFARKESKSPLTLSVDPKKRIDERMPYPDPHLHATC